MKKKLGIITIGQSPRNDVIPEMMEFIGNDIEILQVGALDGLTLDEINKFVIERHDYVLVSRLKDGTSVKFSKKNILPKLQACINKLENANVSIILFLCTGVFPNVFESTVPILYPQKIIHGVMPSLLDKGKVAIITPDKDQVNQTYEKWSEFVSNLEVVSASPYSKEDELSAVIKILQVSKTNIVVMDCMGYNVEMKKRVVEETGKMVILSKTIVGRIIGEILNS